MVSNRGWVCRPKNLKLAATSETISRDPTFYSHRIFWPLWSCSPNMSWCFKTWCSHLLWHINSTDHQSWPLGMGEHRMISLFQWLLLPEWNKNHFIQLLLYVHCSTKSWKTWRHEVQAILFSCQTTCKRRKKNGKYICSLTYSIVSRVIIAFHQQFCSSLWQL